MPNNGVKRVRTCIGCGKQSDKVTLMRIVKASDGTVSFDETGRKPGRGAYVCSAECLDTALKAKKLQRALRGNVGQDEAALIAAQVRTTEQAAIR